MQYLAGLGHWSLSILATLGEFLLFFVDGVRHVFTTPKLLPKIVRQMHAIGVQSLFVIVLIGLFTGLVLGLQGYYVLVKFGSTGFLGAAVSLTLVRELGPVLTAIMLTGRAGSAMVAEIGVMRITDQIDALEVRDIPGLWNVLATRGVAAAATGATRPHAQSQVAPSAELNRPIVCFRAIVSQSVSSSTSG